MKRIVTMMIVCIITLLTVISVNAQTTQATGTVTAWYLNVRTTPYPDAERIAIVSRGYTSGVVGKSSDLAWYQIILEGGYGWVHGNYLSVTNAHTVPVTFTKEAPQQTAVAGGLVNTGALNIRPVPSPTNNVPITYVYRNTPLTIFARNTDNSWYKVVTSTNVQGWVLSKYVDVTSGNINSLPVITENNPVPAPNPTIPASAYGVVNTGALNIRSVPGATNNVPLTYVYEGTSVEILGRDSYSQWLMVKANGVTGWAHSRYIVVTSGSIANTPIFGHD